MSNFFGDLVESAVDALSDGVANAAEEGLSENVKLGLAATGGAAGYAGCKWLYDKVKSSDKKKKSSK